MSNRREDIRHAFFSDAQDHLAAMGVLLLELEVAGKDADSELLSGLLRSAHALKCAAGVLELETAFTLARALESLLDSWNEGTFVPDADTASRVEKAFDLLAMLLTPAGQDPDTVAVYAEKRADAASLAQLIEEGVGVTPQGNGTFCPEEYSVLSPEGEAVFKGHCPDLHLASKAGAHLYVIEFLYEKDLEQKDVTPQALLGFLQKSGYILAIGSSKYSEGSLFVLYSSFLEIDLIAAVFQLDKAQVHVLDLDTLLQGQASWQAAEPKHADCFILQPVKEPEKDSVDELVRQYDLAMEKLREADSDEAGEVLEGWDFSEVVAPAAREISDPFHAVLADMAEHSLVTDDDVLGIGDDSVQPDSSDAHFSGSLSSDSHPNESHPAESHSVEVPTQDDSFEDTGSDDFELEFDDAYLDEEAALLMSELPLEHPLRKVHEDAPQNDDDFFLDTQAEPDLSYLDDALQGVDQAAGVNLDLDLPVEEQPAEASLNVDPSELEQDAATEIDKPDEPFTGGETMIAGFEVKTVDDQAVVFLDGEVTIERSVQLHEALQELLSRYQTLKINLQNVEAADLTFIQLICAAAEDARQRGASLEGDGTPSSAIIEMLAMAGFDTLALERRGLSSVFKV